MYFLKTALFISVFVQRSLANSFCVDLNSDLQTFVSGQKIITGGFKREERYSLLDCIKECWLRSRCKVITYHKTDLTCELGGTSAVVNDVSNQRYVTSYKNSWPPVMVSAGACKSHNCLDNERCVALKSGLHHCVALMVCPAGWMTFKNKCYWFEQNKAIWTDAQRDCVRHGGTLARVDTASVQMFCQKEIQARNLQTVLMAANDITYETDWRWGIAGEPIGYSNWAPGAPSGRTPTADCGGMMPSGFWMDCSCQNPYSYICEKHVI